jgi:hypothetical protein
MIMRWIKQGRGTETIASEAKKRLPGLFSTWIAAYSPSGVTIIAMQTGTVSIS